MTPTRTRWHRRTALAVAVGVSSLAAADPGERGRGLFDGGTPLAAQIVGQGLALPVQASRCINCHSAGPAADDARGQAASGAGRRLAAKIGPALDRESLQRDRPRRGGPPSHYDAASMCRLLRTGIDPVSVIVDRNMPRYEIGTADCDALWAYLVGPS